MIKAEVVFDENRIEFNGFVLDEAQDGSVWFVQKKGNVKQFSELEQAIAYCLEN